MVGIGYWIIMGAFTVIGMVIGNRLKSKFTHYSRIGTRNGKSGKEVAEDMLRHYGIHDVQVVMGQGFLSDHYNPANKTVALSPDVYNGRSIASAAVSAHECGHAVQHNEAYSMLQLRSKLVPVVQFSSSIQQFLFMGVMFGLGANIGGTTMLMILVATFGVTALFSLITLPVEFDASNRALAWLDDSGYMKGEEHDGAKDALWWAAMTYVSAALGALVMFLYFLLSFLGANRE
ncbi:MAG: zinc metallopeptidase [Saprospiraceae bacterium]|jgi:Zn-dependent membrane protease YugP|nr:zinc metallopeptidase [Saprospiraceae bacterium]MBP6448160.1 zinc metallopeptidase [Saprospiraceae bacterium]